jgi:hypothetical protein
MAAPSAPKTIVIILKVYGRISREADADCWRIGQRTVSIIVICGVCLLTTAY